MFAELIDLNNEKFGNDHTRFVSMDIANDPLPKGDLCLVRQVLQHLSNSDIERILDKLSAFRYVLITDGQAPIVPERRRNLNKPTGNHTRTGLFGNGLWLELPPFLLHAKVVLDYTVTDTIRGDELMRTLLVVNP